MTKHLLGKACLALALLFIGTSALAVSALAQDGAPIPVIWRDPGNIRQRDLRRGPAAFGTPAAPFTFVKEVKNGESPKVDVKDARGNIWRVRLGVEAQAETVATRIVWSVGYLVEDAHFYPRLRINGLPRLSRGQEFVRGRNSVINGRLEPKPRNFKGKGNWDWMDNPLEGTRELNGLKVLMVLLNNYDARKENNTIYVVDAGTRTEHHYYVSDLWATLGKANGFGGDRTKNDLGKFLSTRFVMGVNDDGTVKFDYDTRPTGFGIISILHPKYYTGEVKKEKAMRSIPVEDAAWIGSLLDQLTDAQLRAAFNAAHYTPKVRDTYVRSIRQRIKQLTALQPRF